MKNSKANSDKKQSVALSSVFASLFLTIGKFIVGVMTGSMGIISEAAHSGLDLVAAIMTYFAVKIGDKPADKTHHYGHGKVEAVSALMETGLLFITAAWIIHEAIRRLILKDMHIDVAWYAFVIIIISLIVDISRSRALKKVANETKSQALEADALHFSSDIWSSCAVLVGLTCEAFGFRGADAIAALCVSIFVILAGYNLGKRTLAVLVDSAPLGLIKEVKDSIKRVPGVVSIERVRARPMGPIVFIDVALSVDRRHSIEKIREIVEQVEGNIKKKIPEADMVIHTNPVKLGNETLIDKVQVITAKQNLSVHDIVVDTIEKIRYISYDLEVPDSLTIEESHKISTFLEDLIKKDIGEVEITTHIEPIKELEVQSSIVSAKERKIFEDNIRKIAGSVKEIEGVHEIVMRKMADKLFITMHCYVLPNMSLEEAHMATSKLEYLIKQKVEKVLRVVVHIEPKEQN